MAYISFQPSDYFNTLLWTGDGASSKSLTGTGFQPDWTWIKRRSDAQAHSITDSVRGVTKSLRSDSSAAEDTNNANGYVTSFDSDGFTVAKGSDPSRTNTSGATYVGWNWKANGQGSSNTDGSINTTYTSANTTSGFSISTYTGTGANATVGHGLGVAPSIVLCKNTSTTSNWEMYHSSIGAGGQITLNNTNASGNDGNILWNSTAPTSSLFSVGTNVATNNSGSTMIAYCFAEKKGFSKFGSYTGNNNDDGNFIYLGFKPAFIIIKRTNFTKSWLMFDNKRDGYNPDNNQLQPNDTVVEATDDLIDMVSNGFKIRTSSNSFVNTSGGEFIYMAFAEAPIVSSNGVPAVAR